MADLRSRFCQRCNREQKLFDTEQARPCAHCGGVNFDLQPKKHTNAYGVYELTPWDRDFLRVQRIDPQED